MKSLKSLLLRVTLVVAVAGVLVFALRSSRSARYQELRAQADDACAAYRKQPGNADAHVCHFDAFAPLRPAPARIRAAEARIDEAKQSVARGDVARAEATLRDVVASVRVEDRRGLLTEARVAGEVVNRVLDVVAEHRARLGDAAALNIAANAALDSAERPLERDRLERMWILAHYDTQKLEGAPSYSERELAVEMERDDAAMRAMQRALLRGDRDACERAAKDLGPLSGPYPLACKVMEPSLRAQERVKAEVVRAMIPPR